METAVAEDKSAFQFTLPCRERRALSVGVYISRSFNSRSRVGSDYFSLRFGHHRYVSIHAPV